MADISSRSEVGELRRSRRREEADFSPGLHASSASSPDCAKTPRQPATLEKRPPQFRYGAFSLAARGPRTLFSFFQNAISEFSHSLLRRRLQPCEISGLDPASCLNRKSPCGCRTGKRDPQTQV